MAVAIGGILSHYRILEQIGKPSTISTPTKASTFSGEVPRVAPPL